MIGKQKSQKLAEEGEACPLHELFSRFAELLRQV